jgi:hypothetical protein
VTPEEIAHLVEQSRADGDFDTDWADTAEETDERVRRAVDGDLPDTE